MSPKDHDRHRWMNRANGRVDERPVVPLYGHMSIIITCDLVSFRFSVLCSHSPLAVRQTRQIERERAVTHPTKRNKSASSPITFKNCRCRKGSSRQNPILSISVRPHQPTQDSFTISCTGCTVVLGALEVKLNRTPRAVTRRPLRGSKSDQ